MNSWFSKTYLVYFILIVIAALGLGIRIYKLSENPVGFFCDEAAIGYNSYSILTKGTDEYGSPFPFVFRSFDDYKAPLAIYSSIPSIAIFGLNEFATRLPSVLYGTLLIIILFFIGREIHSPRLGLFISFAASTMPWLIHYNRIGFDYTIYSAFFAITVLLFLLSKHNKKYIILAFITAGLTFYTYQPAKLLVPLLLTGVVVIYYKHFLKYKKETLRGAIVFILLSIPLLITFLDKTAMARFNMVSVFSLEKGFTETVQLIAKNYFSPLSLAFFIKDEGTFVTRHFVGGLLPLLQASLPFLIIGFLHTLWTWKKPTSQLLLWWLLIYPVGAAVTIDPPFSGRVVIGAALFAIFIGIGIETIVFFVEKHVKKPIYLYLTTGIIVLIIMINLCTFSMFYFTRYPLYSADFWGWQMGPKQILTYFMEHQDQYDEMFIEGAFNADKIYLDFYDPQETCKKCQFGYILEKLDYTKRQLFAISPKTLADIQIPVTKKSIIYYPDNQVAFYLVSAEHE